MRKSIQLLIDAYKALGIHKEEKGSIFRYTDKYKREKDGTVNIVAEIHSRSEEYPSELVEAGFGHGQRYKTGKGAKELIFTTKIDSEVEESEESKKEESENEEIDNDYLENYYDNEENESEGEEEDVM